MSRKMMYFGTKNRMDWIPCPAVERPAVLRSPTGELEYENGGAFVRRQYAGHRNYEMTWNYLPNAEVEKIEAWAQGVWGVGPYYWVDPLIARGNMLPVDWAFPGVALLGGTPLVPNAELFREPGVSPLASAPSEAVTYGLTVESTSRTLFLPIPPGHTLTFASYAIPDGADVYVSRYDIGSAPTTPARVTYDGDASGHFQSFNGNTTRGIELSIRRYASPGALYLQQMSATLRRGEAPTVPPAWTPGIGHSGCEFVEHPERVDYSAALDRVGVTATLKEVGSWL